MIVHPTNIESTIQEDMRSKPQAAAFARPKLPVSPKGYGFNEFCKVKKLFTDGFIDKDDTLTVKAVVKAFGTSM